MTTMVDAMGDTQAVTSSITFHSCSSENAPLFQRQLDLEETMRGMGVDRFRSGVNKARERKQETSTRSVRRLMDAAHEHVVEGIKTFLAEVKAGTAGRKHRAYHYLVQVDPDLAAHLTIRSILDSVSIREKLTSAALSIANLIEDELRFRAFAEEKPALYRWSVNKLKASPNNHYRRTVMTYTMNAQGVAWNDWPKKDKVYLGIKLIEILVATTGMVRKVDISNGSKNTTTLIEATEDTLAWLHEENSRVEALMPTHLPTIIPPKPWTTPFDGGYWSGRVRGLTLVKTPNRAYLEELAANDMPEVYTAINAMQDTAWAVNTRVLDVMEELWANQSTLANVPNADNIPLPTRPASVPGTVPTEDLTEAQREDLKAWKREASQVHEVNAKMRSKRLQFAKLLHIARMFRDEEAIYFPHQMDFRGRVYAVPLFLHPQGSDSCRALLTFANAVPIGDEEGARWLAIHGTGMFGFDKVSLDDRVQWVLDHERDILASAEDPISNRFWTEADKPWQFLAFCFEWEGFCQQGFDFLSTLPVQMDGSCNGLQNFSAMLRDSVGGRAVNLVPSDKPSDIYQQVADIVAVMVERDAHGGDEEVTQIARGWVGRVTRKVCKRPVMTLAYGSREYGFKTQVFADTVTPMKMAGDFPWEGNGWAAAEYMGKLIWRAVGDVVVAACGAMDWLQASARVAAREGLPVRWTTPTGFVVQQAYRLPNAKRLALTFQDVRIRVSLDQDGGNLDKRKQANGISPNFVHSMDAAHMQRTVNRCHAEGIRSFSLIHDSYGTHAGNAWALAQFLREAFVCIYSDDILANLKAELEAQLPDGEVLPDLPPMGDLDLQLVQESAFFFA